VASKRFPLSDEQLARFRFARGFSRGMTARGQVAPMNLRTDVRFRVN